MFSLPMEIQPDPDDPDLAVLFVAGQIDGRPYRLMLDTGAAKSRVAVDEYTSTLPVAGERQSNGVFGVTFTDELVLLGQLIVGPIEKTNLMVVRSSADRPSLVGMDALGDMALVVDFDRSQVHFAPGGSLPASQPLHRSPGGQPYLHLQFPGAVGLTCWDTGASVTVVNTAFVAANSSLFTPLAASTGTDSTGESQETPMYRMAAATVGGITLAAHTVAAVPLPQDPMPMDLVLGYPALRQYNWTMDFPHNRWDATPVTSDSGQ
ncbi:hypothetical protein Rhe02_45880 [Rhizocola hellebori]|uniref:Peptidase A2 domain-containing protein n=1 Tax=Rhizocola hellebori TaxID=1392758 RepID=A0A8J3VI00_9ACTN|nr:aspartyl protease family protein [Rhizocola hellebori]GIH06521.1 hypothetical protein Rhe02_45880 [Rhizocola hellebori]